MKVKVGECYLEEHSLQKCIEEFKQATEMMGVVIEARRIANTPEVTRFTEMVEAKALGNVTEALINLVSSAEPVVRCKDCKNRNNERVCPMCWVETIDDDDPHLIRFEKHDETDDDGFCHRGEKTVGED